MSLAAHRAATSTRTPDLDGDIVVLGGYGAVGRIVARTLADSYPDRVVGAGRDPRRLGALDVRRTNVTTILSIVTGAALLAFFVVLERARQVPLLPLDLTTRPPMLGGSLMMFAAAGLLVGTFFVTSLLAQRTLGASALATGLVFLPVAVATAIGAQFGGYFLSRVGPRVITISDLGVAGAGLAWRGLTVPHARMVADVFSGFAVAAAGIGAVFVTATATALVEIPESTSGIAGGFIVAYLACARLEVLFDLTAEGDDRTRVMTALSPEARRWAACRFFVVSNGWPGWGWCSTISPT